MHDDKISQIHRAVRATRRQLLDFFESRYGHTSDWPTIRHRLLDVFGADGLERFFQGTGNSQGFGNESDITPSKTHP